VLKVFLFIALVLAIIMISKLRQRVIKLRSDMAQRDRERLTIYQFLDSLGSLLTEGQDVDATMELIVGFAQEATKADAAALFIRDHGTKSFRARVVKGMFPPLHKITSDKLFAKRKYVADLVGKTVIEEGDGIIGQSAQTGESYLVTDTCSDTRLPKLEESGLEIRDVVVVPLIVSGEVLGVLALVNKNDENCFDELDKELVNAIADQAAVTLEMVRLNKIQAEQQRLEQELELAHTFQSLLLPREIPDLENVDIAAYYKSAREVGGDYYDFIELEDGLLGVAIGDVSGKGIPGALVMASVRATLRAEARMSLSPYIVLSRVNEQVVMDTKESIFITVTYGILNTKNGHFCFCRAGHEPVICCDKVSGAVSTLTPEGIALGIIGGDLFQVTEEKSVELSEQSVVFLNTDGVVEAMNELSEEYGQKRFYQIISENSQEHPKEIIMKIISDMEDFTQGIPQHDDITLVAMSWKGPKR
jgi:phosphoserine phosphatase RsbU/P